MEETDRNMPGLMNYELQRIAAIQNELNGLKDDGRIRVLEYLLRYYTQTAALQDQLTASVLLERFRNQATKGGPQKT